MMKCTVIIPAYNEEKSIVSVLNSLLNSRFIDNFEILVIDDGSADNTAEFVRNIGIVKIIRHPYNKGYGAALKTGILESKAEFVALFDADGQHSVEDLDRLFEKMENFDMLVGSRGRKSYQSLLRKPGKAVLGWFVNLLSNRKIPDINSGLRIFNTQIIKRYLHLMPQGFSFSTTSTVALNSMGFNVGYIDITTAPRVGRKSNVRIIRDGFKAILLIINLTVLFNPQKVFLPIGLLFLFLSMILFIVNGFVSEFDITDSMVLLFVTGILIMFLGILAEQISAIRRELHSLKD